MASKHSNLYFINSLSIRKSVIKDIEPSDSQRGIKTQIDQTGSSQFSDNF